MKMRRSLIFLKVAGIVVLVGLVLSVTYQISQSQHSRDIEPPILPTIPREPSATRPAYCVAIPREEDHSTAPSPTPRRGEIRTPAAFQTVAPLPINQTFDLSPNLTIEEKSRLVVFRCDGTYDEYWAGPEVDVLQAIGLEAGDVILYSFPPASLMGHEAPNWPETEVPATPVPLTDEPSLPPSTPEAYPAPDTATPEGYPAPGTATPEA